MGYALGAGGKSLTLLAGDEASEISARRCDVSGGGACWPGCTATVKSPLASYIVLVCRKERKKEIRRRRRRK